MERIHQVIRSPKKLSLIMIKVIQRTDAIELLSDKERQAKIFGGKQFAMISISCIKDESDPINEKYPSFDTEREMIELHQKYATEYVTDFLPVSFLDIVPRKDLTHLDDYLMTEAHADAIIDFIESTKDLPLVVHCTAGISRSGAVGAYASIVRNEEKEFWDAHEKYIHPNVHVLSLLKRHLHEGI